MLWTHLRNLNWYFKEFGTSVEESHPLQMDTIFSHKIFLDSFFLFYIWRECSSPNVPYVFWDLNKLRKIISSFFLGDKNGPLFEMEIEIVVF